MHLDSISNGFGSQSMGLLVLRKRGIITATLSASADTGSEIDCLLSDGRRMEARKFYEVVIEPYCRAIGLESAFVRTVNKHGRPLLPLHEAMILQESATPGFVPVFGSRGGRMAQQCTDKWKIRALRQEARRRGAKRLRSAIGLHSEEMGRVSGRFKIKEGRFNIFQDGTENKDGIFTPLHWCEKYYPYIDLQMNRDDCRNLCKEEGLPFIVSSQCDMCPHKDADRWFRNKPATIEWAANLEAGFLGNFFLTDQRIPLKLAMQNMKPSGEQNDFGCQNDQCGF